MKRTKRKKRDELVSRRIVYGNNKCPHDRPQVLKVDVRCGEIIDDDYAAAMVAVRTGTPLENVRIVRITGSDDD